jgi:hypothetical protein
MCPAHHGTAARGHQAAIIEVAAVCERFGRVQALAVLDLPAGHSSVPAVPGTGKTTLVRDANDAAGAG